ncbi:MAG TPA: histidine phosphatase family protein [Chitinophagaceae bacterium]|nr:histidine phosphatase family protein [Chitinophagaceae bacterium]
MKQLWIMRHGEAATQASRDHERSLAFIAKRQFETVSQQIEKEIARPQVVLSSDAQRTKETTAFWKQEFGIEEENVSFIPELYLAESDQIMEVLQSTSLSDATERVLLIGHNPGLSVFAMQLLNQTHQAFQGFPTGSLMIVDLPITQWKDIQFNQGIYNTFIQP